MMRNSIFVGVLLLLLGLLLVPAPVSAEGNTYYVSPTGSNSNPGTEASPWRNILFAVNSASSGDTIKVMDNDILETVDYTENITILPGKDNLTITRYNNTGLNPQVKSGSGGSVFVIQSDYVTISGLDIYGVTLTNAAGIYLDSSSDHCTISDNRCGWEPLYKNYCGISVNSSSHHTIAGNVCSSNDICGIQLVSSEHSGLSGNTCNANQSDAIRLVSSNHNTITANTCNSSVTGNGMLLDQSNNNTTSSNTATNNSSHGIKLVSSFGNTMSGNICTSNDSSGIKSESSYEDTISGNMCNSNNYAGIDLASSYSNAISSNTCDSNKYYGINLSSANSNTISGNSAANQSDGIHLSGSTNNTLTENTSSSNSNGIGLYSSNSNTIYLNNFINNASSNIFSSSSANTWNSPEEVTYLYGSCQENTLGNYYSDHALNDTDGDGITDSSYALPNKEPADEYAIATTSDNYKTPCSEPAQDEFTVEISVGLASIAGKYDYVWAYSEPDWHLYYPKQGTNEIGNLEPNMGFWIHTIEDCALVYGDNTINLVKGWNLMSWFSDEPTAY